MRIGKLRFDFYTIEFSNSKQNWKIIGVIKKRKTTNRLIHYENGCGFFGKIILGKILRSNSLTRAFAASALIMSLSLVKTVYAGSFGPISSTIIKTENIWASAKKHPWDVQYQIVHCHLPNWLLNLEWVDFIIDTSGA